MIAVGKMQKRSFYSVVHKYLEANKRYGWKECLWKLYNPGDIKFGKEVGTDQFGNKYYEDTTDLHGQQRWTEYKVKTHDEFSADQIPPEWHLWMHSFSDAKPGEAGQNPETWAKVPISTVSHAPYGNHVGPTTPFTENPTTLRRRGYGIDNHKWLKAGEPEKYYMQPNHPLRQRQRPATIHDEIDYNNPDAPPAHSSEPLVGLDKN
ncbi:NADH ubiquinone oxidoreductase subunit [Thraustotheca clavata]|uniref:NADH dehydrogenase [ubiquinone] 1 alpha subcomplex subunit 12 n=1 Tax=Thraustotheca clavata TaxID=74557 RepID=A0A1V9ZWS6_9STRA|nr:NADH ubiquinone oxidoreductase subunit [Thraustotheca clavata]